MKFRPLHDRVLVRRAEAETTTAGGTGEDSKRCEVDTETRNCHQHSKNQQRDARDFTEQHP